MNAELRELNERWNRAWLEKDAGTVERLMAEDYLYVAPNGMTLDCQGILTVIRSSNYRLDYATRSEVIVRPLGQQAAAVRYRARSAGAFEGTSFAEDHRCVMVCEKQAGDWRIVLEHHSLNGS